MAAVEKGRGSESRGPQRTRKAVVIGAAVLVAAVAGTYGYNIHHNVGARSLAENACQRMDDVWSSAHRTADDGRELLGIDFRGVARGLAESEQENCRRLNEQLDWWRWNLGREFEPTDGATLAREVENLRDEMENGEFEEALRRAALEAMRALKGQLTEAEEQRIARLAAAEFQQMQRDAEAAIAELAKQPEEEPISPWEWAAKLAERADRFEEVAALWFGNGD